MLTGILWIVIGVLLYALYACVMTIKEYQRNTEHLEHRLDRLLDDWTELANKDISHGE